MIVGQDNLIVNIKRIFDIFVTSNFLIKPHFILTGGSGSGKTFTVRTLCTESKLNFFEVNAAQLTKEGTSGNSVSKALAPLLNLGGKPTVIFVDEFDKLFISGNSNDSHAHETTVGVQNEFLKILEGNSASVFGDYGKYINVPVNNCLFVFAGSFNNEPDIDLDRLLDLGMKREFIGRVSLVFNTNPLGIEEMIKILDKSVLLDTYCKLFNKNVDDIKPIIINYLREYQEFNVIGARMIDTLIHTYFITGKLPDKMEKPIVFTRHMQLPDQETHVSQLIEEIDNL